jgi:hypothetical protein
MFIPLCVRCISQGLRVKRKVGLGSLTRDFPKRLAKFQKIIYWAVRKAYFTGNSKCYCVGNLIITLFIMFVIRS